MHRQLAPIAVFAYKRPEYLRLTLEALSKCPLAGESKLFVFCDGPKASDDTEKIKQVRLLARAQRWPGELNVIERESNWGLSKSVTSGVSDLCTKFGAAIVLEDDHVVAPSFLRFMNEALHRYKDDSRVMQVSGYSYPVKTAGKNDAFFICHSSCWGWATWQRAWKDFGFDSQEYEKLKGDRRYRLKFDMGGSYPYFQMLDQQVAGKNDSWGVLWYLTMFKKNGFVLMPRHTLVSNIGRDTSGTHVGRAVYQDELADNNVKSWPEFKPDEDAFKAIAKFLKGKHVPWYRRILRKLESFSSLQ